MPSERPRLLFVHAHPDDESMNNGATIAHYAALGAEVHVVTCTLGEEGEVIGERWAQLVVDRADQLGGYRIGELSAALHALGIGDPIFLGGAGHWRDSGMAGTEPRSEQQRFVDADERDVVDALVSILRTLRPHVVVTYDPRGGYGHPDHIRAHEITTAAVEAAAVDDGSGAPWAVPKFYWTVASSSLLISAAAALQPQDLLPDWTVPTEGIGGLGYPDERITTVVDARDGLDAKIAALRAHATQVVVGPTERAFALSNNLALPLVGIEHYILMCDRDGAPQGGPESDLLAGLDLGGD
jgi:N-acetyl-1-D-myo-inositol-2-amino-2-deoxy-alpha-D-glucopyranoside deacetylase